MFLFGDFDDGVESLTGDFWRKMNVADKEEAERLFDVTVVESVTSIVKDFHRYYFNTRAQGKKKAAPCGAARN